MGIYDAMLLCRADVQTYCFGLAASMGAFLLGAGKRGKRYSMPNSRIMVHQPLGGASGQAVDIEIQVSRARMRAHTRARTLALPLPGHSGWARCPLVRLRRSLLQLAPGPLIAPPVLIATPPPTPTPRHPPRAQAKEIMYHKANLNRIMADYTVSCGHRIARISQHAPPLCQTL